MTISALSGTPLSEVERLPMDDLLTFAEVIREVHGGR